MWSTSLTCGFRAQTQTPRFRWAASRITFELRTDGIVIARRTVTKILRNLGLHRRRFIEPNGDNNRKPQVIIAKRPGQMVHVDVKKVGRIPNGGGWRTHCRLSAQAKRSQRRKARSKQPRIGYTYLHSAIDGNTRLAYTEARDDETAATAIDFMNNARVFFAAHGITRIEGVITDNGSCYRAADFTYSLREKRHYRIKPYTPKNNGKVERHNRILAEEFGVLPRAATAHDTHHNRSPRPNDRTTPSCHRFMYERS